MNWRVEIRPNVEEDVAEAASWYDSRQPGLGADFVEQIIQVWDSLGQNPFLNARKDSPKNIRWRYPDRFPYRVIYEINEADRTVIVLGVLHAARDDRHWQKHL